MMNGRILKITGVIVIFFSILGGLFYYNWQEFLKTQEEETGIQSQIDENFIGVYVFGSNILFTPENFSQDALNDLLTESWYVHIFGNVKYEVYIGLSYLRNGDNFTYIANKEYNMLNRYSTQWTARFWGVALDDVFDKTDCLKKNSTRFYFRASTDGYRSFDCTIKVVKDNPGLFLLTHMENYDEFLPQDEGGDGPIKAVAPLEPLQNDPEIQQIYADKEQPFVYNSQYSVKYLNQVIVI